MKPIISYTGAKSSYNVNVPISTLIPNNTGGAVTPKLRISTVSGNSNNLDYPKDGAPQIATYRYPNSVSARSDSSLVVIDEWSQTIRIINSNGISSALAGKFISVNGTLQTGYVDGQGETARFNTPSSAAFDDIGNIIVLDTYNYRIRKVTPTGVVSTLAGSGIAGLSDGTGILAQFKLLTSLWIDNSNNIFVTDGYRIRKITSTGIVTTIAGNGTRGNLNGNGINSSFKNTRGITGDNIGNLYISDSDNSSIRKIDNIGNVTTFVTGISAAGIVFQDSILYVADFTSNQIKTVSTITGIIDVFAGSGVGQFKDGFDTRDNIKSASLYAPEGLAVISSGINKTIYVADKNSQKIRKIDNANFIISPELPEGLKIDSSTGIISGTPTQISTAKLYTISCGNAEGLTNAILYFDVK